MNPLSNKIVLQMFTKAFFTIDKSGNNLNIYKVIKIKIWYAHMLNYFLSI